MSEWRQADKKAFAGLTESVKFEDLKVGDTIIFRVKSFISDNRESWFDGQIVHVNVRGVSVCYLMGYKSENETLKNDEDAFFLFDDSQPWFYPRKIDSGDINYNGKFRLIVRNKED